MKQKPPQAISGSVGSGPERVTVNDLAEEKLPSGLLRLFGKVGLEIEIDRSEQLTKVRVTLTGHAAIGAVLSSWVGAAIIANYLS